jgi:hypothetical protein
MAACAAGRQPAAGKDRLMSSVATAVGVGLLGVLAGVPARPVSSACPVHQQRLRPGGMTRYRAGHGAAVVRGHPAPRRPGLGLGGPGLPGLGVRLPGAGGDRRRHPAAAQPQHLPGVPGGGRAAAGRQPRPWASLAGSVAACSRRPRSAGCSCRWRCWLPTAWGGQPVDCPNPRRSPRDSTAGGP